MLWKQKSLCVLTYIDSLENCRLSLLRHNYLYLTITQLVVVSHAYTNFFAKPLSQEVELKVSVVQAKKTASLHSDTVE